MTKPQVVLYHGADWEAQALGKFKKDVVRIGRWVHPTTGQKIEFDAARLARLALNTELYRKNVDHQVIPFPDGHKFNAVDSIGEFESFKVEGDRIVGVCQPRGKGIEEKLASKAIRSVSAYIDFNVKDSHGNVYPEAITHVAATPYPVVTGQQDFVALSAREEGFDLFIPEELSIGGSDVLKLHDHLRKELQDRMDEHKVSHKLKGADHADTKKAALAVQDAAHRLRRQAEVIHSHTMNATGGPTYLSSKTEGTSPEGNNMEVFMKKQMALALGLPEDAPEEKILEAFKGLSSQAGEFGLKLDAGKFSKLPPPSSEPKTDLEKQQAVELAQFKAEKALNAAKDMAKKVEGLIKAGIVPPEKAEILSRLMAVPGKVQALALAKDKAGLENVQVDVSADVEALLSGLPGITTQRLSTEQRTDAEKSDAAIDKKVDEVLSRIQPEAAGKK